MNIAWIDIETTGLNPLANEIIEIAVIITDSDLNEIARMSTPVKPNSNPLAWPKWPYEQHCKSGLMGELKSAPHLNEAQQEVRNFIWRHCGGPDCSVTPAGLNVHFDINFLRKHMPEVTARLHYRHLDMGPFRWAIQRWTDEDIIFNPPHRALDDIAATIDYMREVRARFFS